MKGLKFYALGLCAALLIESCGMSNTAKGGIIGGTSGAALGTALGAILAKKGNKTKVGAIAGAAGAAVGTAAGILIGRKMDKAKKEAEKIANAQVEGVVDGNGYDAVKVTFDSGILFPTGKSTLNAIAKSSLDNFATNVLIPNNLMSVGVIGFTDNQSWRNSTAEQSKQKNLVLSQQRAAAVSNYLLQSGVAQTQIKEVVGLGEDNPVADNSTATGQAQNRRVEVYLYASPEMIQQAEAGTLQ